jgi:hypothetical protein
MTEPEAQQTTKSKGGGSRILMAYLLIGIVFPTLFIVVINVWKLPMLLLSAISAPKIVLEIVWGVGVLGGLAASFWCCREIWRRRPR